jgi:putative transposase
VPKGWKKELYGKIRQYLGLLFHELASQRSSQIVEGHMVQDHMHMLIRIPIKYSVAEVVGYLKGKSAISVARQFSGRQRNFNGENFWARGYAVSTVGFEESQIRAYIKKQEQLDDNGFDEKGNFKAMILAAPRAALNFIIRYDLAVLGTANNRQVPREAGAL